MDTSWCSTAYFKSIDKFTIEAKRVIGEFYLGELRAEGMLPHSNRLLPPAFKQGKLLIDHRLLNFTPQAAAMLEHPGPCAAV